MDSLFGGNELLVLSGSGAKHKEDQTPMTACTAFSPSTVGIGDLCINSAFMHTSYKTNQQKDNVAFSGLLYQWVHHEKNMIYLPPYCFGAWFKCGTTELKQPP